MKKKVKTSSELAKLLNLSEEDAIEIEIRSDLNNKIIETASKQKLTHAKVAELASTSRTKVTALMNRNTKHISTSLMIRILAALGVKVKISYKTMKIAA